MIDNAVNVSLGGSFMLNAGICGFIRFLEHNNAAEGTDYEINGQTLSINPDYIRNSDIPALYVKTMAEILEPSTKFYRVLNERFEIEKLNNNLENADEKQKKRLNALYKSFSDLMLKKGFLYVYSLLPEYDGITPITEEMIDSFSNCEDEKEKFNKYESIIQLLKQEKVKNLLIYNEIITMPLPTEEKPNKNFSLKLFFHRSNRDKPNDLMFPVSCLYKKGQKYEDTFQNFFLNHVLDEIELSNQKKKNYCIECLNPMSSSNKQAFSFLIDTVDDVKRKTSYYWNCKADAYVCPVCGLMYAFIPLGFAIMGTDAVFINSNNSIESLCNIMNTQREQTDDDSNKSIRRRIMRTFTSEKIDALNKTTGNIQVIIRSPEISHFKFDVIDKHLISGLNKGKKYLSMLEKRWISADGQSFVSVYDMVFDCILEHLSLYPVIDKILKLEIDKNNNLKYLKDILMLENIFNGGNNMNELNKKVNEAFAVGISLRHSILGKDADIETAEDDNRLRGFVYRLVTLTSVGNLSQFMDTVVLIYSGFSLPVPPVFKDCYISDQMFKAIAHGFILGLKYVKFNENNDTKGE